MKVYAIIPHSYNFSGCALIAADDATLAKNLYIGENELNAILFTLAKCTVELVEDIVYTGEKIIILDTLKCTSIV